MPILEPMLAHEIMTSLLIKQGFGVRYNLVQATTAIFDGLKSRGILLVEWPPTPPEQIVYDKLAAAPQTRDELVIMIKSAIEDTFVEPRWSTHLAAEAVLDAFKASGITFRRPPGGRPPIRGPQLVHKR